MGLIFVDIIIIIFFFFFFVKKDLFECVFILIL